MRNLIPLSLICFVFCATGVYADDEATLNQAMRTFNAHAKNTADKKIVLNAIWQQTKIAEKTLQGHMDKLNLNYAELLTAQSLAEGGSTNVDNIVALKGRGKGWVAISRDLKIDANSIIARLSNADKMVLAAQSSVSRAPNAKKPPLPGYTDIRTIPARGLPPKGGQ